MDEKNLDLIKKDVFKKMNLKAIVTEYMAVKNWCFHRYDITWGTAICPHCGETVHNNADDAHYHIELHGHCFYSSSFIATPTAMKKRVQLFEDFKIESSCSTRHELFDTEKKASFIYVESASDGIDISNYSCKVFYNEDKQELDWTLKKNSYMHFVLGQKNTAYKILKNGSVPTDVFGCVGLNSKTITSDETFVIFEGGLSIADFLMQENMQQFTKISQLPRILSTCLCSEKIKNYYVGFKAYIALMSEFPQFELLYKMGCLNLFRSACEAIIHCKSIKQMKESVKNITKLIDDHATKGKQVLRIPSYIAEYLSNKNANLREYLTWCDIYELTKISKENFEEIISSIPFMSFFCGCFTDSATSPDYLGLLPLLLRYGYDISKLLRYLQKERTTAVFLKDYLEMSEYLGIEIVLYPENLSKRHDELSKLRNDKDNEKINQKLAQIAEKVEKAITEIIEEERTFTVVIPKSIADFFDEGNRMNNCVGHYSNKVAKGDCIIFFVRLKENPSEGYITAEYRCNTHTIGQFFYKNNRAVEDPKAIRFGRKICDLIRKIKP